MQLREIAILRLREGAGPEKGEGERAKAVVNTWTNKPGMEMDLCEFQANQGYIYIVRPSLKKQSKKPE